MKSKHIFLNLFLIKFPITAITSIIHRVSGVFLFICVPFVLYFLKIGLESESAFLLSINFINTLYVKFFLFCLIFSFIFHLVFGIKHIIMDLGFFDGKHSSSKFSITALIISFGLIFLSILL